MGKVDTDNITLYMLEIQKTTFYVNLFFKGRKSLAKGNKDTPFLFQVDNFNEAK